ncbi:MAG: F0F1 ATP synthase subunit alpha, partial [bacterium]
VAGKLRIDLAQYRDLASFAQFGSDLDKATLAILRRGERMTEILKQPQYVPMAEENQVTIIFAAGKGYIDDIELADVKRFEDGFHPWLNAKYPQILHSIKTTKDLDDQTEKLLIKALDEFKSEFVAGHIASDIDKPAAD